ncbi:hypothetical protein ACTGU4_10445, partial [Streptococcus suis]
HSIIPQYEKVRKKYIQKFDKKIALYQRLEHFCVIQTVKLPGMVTSTITRFFSETERETKLDILMAKIDEQNETLLRLEKKIESLEKLGELQGRD